MIHQQIGVGPLRARSIVLLQKPVGLPVHRSVRPCGLRPVSFAAVASKAAVSTDFLYSHAVLRRQIEQHRAKPGTLARQDESVTESGSTSSVVQALSARLTAAQQAHRREVAELRKALQAAHGENLDLRRRLAQYEAE